MGDPYLNSWNIGNITHISIYVRNICQISKFVIQTLILSTYTATKHHNCARLK